MCRQSYMEVILPLLAFGIGTFAGAEEKITVLQVLDDFEGTPDGALPMGWEAVPLLGQGTFQQATLSSSEGATPPPGNTFQARVGCLDYAFDEHQEARFHHRGYLYLPFRGRIRGRIKALSVRVYGDGSGNMLIASIRNAEGLQRQRSSEPITWQGWREVWFPLGALSEGDLLEALVLEHTEKGQAQGRLFLDDVIATTEVKPDEGVCVDLRTNRYSNVMASSEAVRISALVSNLCASNPLTLRCVFANVDGTQFGGLEQPITVHREHPVWIPLTFHPPHPQGFFIASTTVESASGVKDGLYVHLAVTPAVSPAPPTERWAYGINSPFPWRPEQMWRIPFTCRLLSHAGLRWLRTEMSWQQMEPQRGKLQWDWFDYMQQTAQHFQLELVPFVQGSPRWASAAPQEPDWACYPPANMEDFGDFLFAVADHYRDTIRHWEIWSGENQDGFWRAEPDPARYAEMLASACRAVHRVNPGHKVVVGGLIGPDTRFLGDLLKDPRRQLFDIVGLQIPPPAGALWDAIDQGLWKVNQWQEKKRRPHPPWVVWTGVGTDYTLETQRPQAETLVKAYIRALTFGSRLFWNLFRDIPQEGALSGLFLYNDTPKPAYAAVCALTWLLPNAVLGGDIPVAQGACCYAFNTDRGPVVVFWSDTERHELLLPNPNLQVFDWMGNPAGSPTEEGRALTVSTSPLYFTGVTDPAAAVRDLMQAPKL